MLDLFGGAIAVLAIVCRRRPAMGTARSTFSGLRLHALFLEAPNNVRFVYNAAPPYHTLFRPFRYHPGAARSPLKPVETASGC